MSRLLPALLAGLLSLPAWGASPADLLARTAAALQEEGTNYRSADSGTLAWGESYLLEGYVYLYLAGGDASWLDRLVRHADVIFAHLTPGADGRPGWRTDHYSVAAVSLRPQGRVASDLRPDEERIFDIKRAGQVTGHRYRLVCRAPGRLQVVDLSEFRELPPVECTSERDFTVAPGVELRCDRLPQPPEAWLLETKARQPLEYVVHDGMVLQPLAHFIFLARSRPELQARFSEPAQRYLELLERELIPKWDTWWRDFSPRTGAYLAQDDWTQRFPGVILPHNQYLALGRVVLWLYRTTGNPHYLDRATRMANFLHHHLQVDQGRYLWHYWDPARPQDQPGKRMQVVEDTSHAHIDVGFMVDCCQAGMVFDREDMALLCRTLLSMRVPGSRPALGDRVGSAEGDTAVGLDWIRLAEYDPEVQAFMSEFAEQRLAGGGANAAAVAQLLTIVQ